ncbi:glycosyltransferase [uncultured Gimesia sp.]|uniref:glycosyltransferase n=1 Tax=uncultured Gimesia sp. TaxID=1678688 RepID=UPI0030DC556C|tara:strand:+ start:17712 stop:20063 length:2352 start_codon:yes stop_codon:yes gene_type:complete
MGNSRVRNIQQWAVGITTAPRKKSTLHQTLVSLKTAGWDSPRLFAEPGVEIPSEFNRLPVSRRDETLGAFPNWYLALTELVLRNPRAEAFLLCQDDVLFSADIRDYLERTLWPANQIGVVSIYCPSHYSQAAKPGFIREDRGWKSWGALAYIFSNPSARAILSDSMVLNHRDFGPAEGLHHIDSVVGYWCERNHLPYYVHSPSLAQHIGESSTIYPRATTSGNRQAKDFQNPIELRPRLQIKERSTENLDPQYSVGNNLQSEQAVLTKSVNLTNNRHQVSTSEYDIDIFIPYHRNLHLVPQTIDSILWQHKINPFIHLVNDCSREDDRPLFHRYGHLENIQWHKTKQNCGPYAIANSLFYHVKSSVIGIADSDDIYLPNHFRTALDELDRHGADVWGSTMTQFLNPLENHNERNKGLVNRYPIADSGMHPDCLPFPRLVNGTMVIRKKTFEAANGFDGRYHCAVDTEFSQRIQFPSEVGAAVYFSKHKTALRRICSNSLSNSDNRYGLKSPERDAIKEESLRRYAFWKTQEKINPRNYGTLDSQEDVLDPDYKISSTRDSKVYACLTSIPRRVYALEKTVASLINQVDGLKIHLNDYHFIPEFLKHPKLELVFGDNSLMSCTKFLWADRLSGYILTCDDDLIYPPDYIDRMTAAIDKYKCIVCAHGSKLKPGMISSYYKDRTVFDARLEIPQDMFVDIPGTGTMGWHTDDIKLRMNDFDLPGMEDIAAYRAIYQHSYSVVVVAHPESWLRSSTHKNDGGLYSDSIRDDSKETEVINANKNHRV